MTDGGPRPEDVELGNRLRLTVGRLSRRLRRAEVGTPHPLQRAVLEDLARYGSLRQSDLVDLEEVADPTMSRVVTSLLTAGLVDRIADGEDARCRRVSLTPAGLALLRQVVARDADVLRPRLARLSPDARASVVAALPLLEAMSRDEPSVAAERR